MRRLLATGILMASACATAGEWRQSITLPASLEQDSNPLLSSTNKKGVTRTVLMPTYNLIGNYGIDEIKAGLGLRVERSSDQMISMNREDPNLLLGWRRTTETGEFGLTAKYDQVSSRAAQLEETGLIVGDSTRNTRSLGGNWRSVLSERTTLTTEAEYKTVTYDSGTLTNFNNTTAGVTWAYAWGDRTEPFLRFSASHYEPEKTTIPVSDNYLVTGGVKVRASEHLDWTLQGGTSTVLTRTTDTTWQGSFMMNYFGERFDAALNVGRSVSASGEGGFVSADQIKVSHGYALADRSRAGWDASWQNNKATIPNSIRLIGLWGSHELSTDWNLRLYYQHKLRRQSGQPDASGNMLGVTLVFSHPDF
jgi:hypothetical protein